MEWRAIRAKRVLAGLLRIGWRIKRQRGSHRILERIGWPDFTFAFHDREEIGPRMLSRIANEFCIPRIQKADLKTLNFTR